MVVKELIERLQALNMPTARIVAYDADEGSAQEVSGLLVDPHHNIIEIQTDDD